MRSIVRATEFREVVIAIEKPIDFAAEEACLARYSKKYRSIYIYLFF